ncbi:hypothetical protein FH972_022610 [Carpinus fangiana]|uniref:Secreted protein n=1 Tax=Carpinus fangiana TaxID=176857 RepID=A0A5N6KTE7_9ROSI|nr:hypothetical protein FH972_022610 [Carpinus fangiana]
MALRKAIMWYWLSTLTAVGSGDFVDNEDVEGALGLELVVGSEDLALEHDALVDVDEQEAPSATASTKTFLTHMMRGMARKTKAAMAS